MDGVGAATSEERCGLGVVAMVVVVSTGAGTGGDVEEFIPASLAPNGPAAGVDTASVEFNSTLVSGACEEVVEIAIAVVVSTSGNAQPPPHTQQASVGAMPLVAVDFKGRHHLLQGQPRPFLPRFVHRPWNS